MTLSVDAGATADLWNKTRLQDWLNNGSISRQCRLLAGEFHGHFIETAVGLQEDAVNGDTCVTPLPGRAPLIRLRDEQ